MWARVAPALRQQKPSLRPARWHGCHRTWWTAALQCSCPLQKCLHPTLRCPRQSDLPCTTCSSGCLKLRNAGLCCCHIVTCCALSLGMHVAAMLPCWVLLSSVGGCAFGNVCTHMCVGVLVQGHHCRLAEQLSVQAMCVPA